jgi:hypothetical protein
VIIYILTLFSTIRSSRKFKLVVFLPFSYLLFSLCFWLYGMNANIELYIQYFFLSFYLSLIAVGFCLSNLKASKAIKHILLIAVVAYFALILPNRVLFKGIPFNNWTRDYRSALKDIKPQNANKTLLVHLCVDYDCPTRVVGGIVYLANIYPQFRDRYDAVTKWKHEIGNFNAYNELVLVLAFRTKQIDRIVRILGPEAEVKIYKRVLTARLNSERTDLDRFFYEKVREIKKYSERVLYAPSSTSLLIPLVVLSRLHRQESDFNKYYDEFSAIYRASKDEIEEILNDNISRQKNRPEL